MAFGAGTAAKLWVSSVTGLDTDLSPYITKIDLKMIVDEIETTTLGNTERQYITGFKSANISGEGVWDPSADNVLFGQRGATANTVRYSPQGTATGKIFYSGAAVQTDYSPPTDVQNAVTFTFAYRVTNGLTRGTH